MTRTGLLESYLCNTLSTISLQCFRKTCSTSPHLRGTALLHTRKVRRDLAALYDVGREGALWCRAQRQTTRGMLCTTQPKEDAIPAYVLLSTLTSEGR